MIKKYIKKVLDKLILAEKSPTKLTLSFCLGAYLAFSPWLLLQTWLVFPLAWILKLNATVAMSSLYLISTPITFPFIIIIDYMFGTWLFESVLKINAVAYNPSFMQSLNNFLNKYINLEKYLGSNICFWCYIIGANILGLFIAVIAYPIMKPIFKRLVKQFEKVQNKLSSK